MTFVVQRSQSDGRWRWFLAGNDGRKLAMGEQSYEDRNDCLHAVALVRQARKDKVVDEPDNSDIAAAE